MGKLVAKSRLKRLAFTLVELLVVISIIAILISLMLPALGKSKQAAILVKCAANFHQLGICYSSYSNDARSYLPYNLAYYTNDLLSMSTDVRDAMKNSYGMPPASFECPALDHLPKTSLYMNGIVWNWSVPQSSGYVDPNTGIAGPKIVPTSYVIYAGRAQTYFPPLNTIASIPMKVDERKAMINGATITPWMLCYLDWAPAVGYYPGDYYGEPNRMHFGMGLNALQADASVLFKKYPGSDITDPNGDAAVVKFVHYPAYNFNVAY